MRVIVKQPKISRREMLRTSGGATLGVAMAVSGAMVACPKGAWAVTPKALQPHSVGTLIQMSRDIYPHDRLSDKYYAKVVTGFDEKAADDSEFKSLMEDGVAQLDNAAKQAKASSFIELGWELDRVELLRGIETTPFFQAVRGNLVTGLYNNPEVWPLFGYEGEAESKGGYLEHGFDDIDWL